MVYFNDNQTQYGLKVMNVIILSFCIVNDHDAAPQTRKSWLRYIDKGSILNHSSSLLLVFTFGFPSFASSLFLLFCYFETLAEWWVHRHIPCCPVLKEIMNHCRSKCILKPIWKVYFYKLKGPLSTWTAIICMQEWDGSQSNVRTRTSVHLNSYI